MDIAAQNTTAGTGSPEPGDPDPVTERVPTDRTPSEQGPAQQGQAQQTPAGPVPSLGEKAAAFRLRRSATDKMLGGVCGGLAADLGVDAAMLRIAVLALTLLTGGAFALVYLAAWLLAPVS